MVKILKNLLDKFTNIVKEWHPTKNKQITLREIRPSSHKKIWWICIKNHIWEASVSSRTQGNGCPYCSGRYPTKENNLAVLFPKVSSEWDYSKNFGLKPEQFKPKSGKKVWWKCSKNHEWQSTVSHRVCGRGCPYCSGRYASKENNLSVNNPEIISEWDFSKNETLSPEDLTSGSDKKVWWLCCKGHSWKASISKRSIEKTGCPYCKNKKEQKVRDILENIFNDKFPKKRPSWLKNPKTGCLLELDGYNERLNIAFEYDGIFHDTPFYSLDIEALDNQKYRDNIKNLLCFERGIKLLRVHHSEDNNLEKFIKQKLLNK